MKPHPLPWIFLGLGACCADLAAPSRLRRFRELVDERRNLEHQRRVRQHGELLNGGVAAPRRQRLLREHVRLLCLQRLADDQQPVHPSTTRTSASPSRGGFDRRRGPTDPEATAADGRRLAPKWHADVANSGRSAADTSKLAGTVDWTVPFGLPGSNASGAPNTYDDSPVVAADGTIYLVTMTGVLWAIDPTGNPLLVGAADRSLQRLLPVHP